MVPTPAPRDGRRPHPHSGLLSGAQPRCRQAAEARPENRPQQQQRPRRCFCCWWLRWWRWLCLAAPAHQHEEDTPQHQHQAAGGHQAAAAGHTHKLLPRLQRPQEGQEELPSLNDGGGCGSGGDEGAGAVGQGSMALLNTTNSPPAHCFVKRTFHKPVYCHHCTDLLWGIIGQGYTCEGECPSPPVPSPPYPHSHPHQGVPS